MLTSPPIHCKYDVAEPEVWPLTERYRRAVSVDGTSFVVEAPKGFRWDGASVPRPVWPLVSRWGKHSAAALVHDRLYATQEVDRETADKAMRNVMIEDGVAVWRREAVYRGVRAFGWMKYDRS